MSARRGTIVGGRYRLDEPLEVTGRIVGYLATHLDVGQDVVVSSVRGRTALDDLTWVPAFRREMRVIEKLRHPTIARVVDFGQMEDGEPFIVTEAFDGISLARKLKDGPLELRAAIALLTDVADALHYANQFGVFHLGCTPDKVMVAERYPETAHQVVDFLGGVWHQIEPSAARAPDRRVAPPEVTAGEDPTPASEVYVLGQLAWACLLGGLPFDEFGREAAHAAHSSSEPWKIPDDANLPAGLGPVIERAVSKSAKDRYASCAEFVAALESYGDSAAETLRLRAVRPSREGFFPTKGSIFAGKFEVDEILGVGGFGRVFKANDIASGRPLALKVLRPDRSRQEAEARRFVREGKLIFSYLTNPHTISVFDYGETDDGALYIAFEYIDGEGLDQRIARVGQLSPTQVARILEQCLASLSEAHGMGVLHRDIKPANIMLSHRNGVEDWVTVLDFGVAKIGSDLMETAELTMTGASVGTPRYMSPEQIIGDPVGGESDIYSLGLVTYELLTGERAIGGANTLQIITNQLDPQSVILPRTATLPTSFALLVNKMMRKERQSRYQSAHEVLTDLRALERGVSADDTIDTGAR